MKRPPFLPAAALVAVLFVSSGCDSLPKRISDRQPAYEALPADTRERVLKGNVTAGDSREVVLMALGEPKKTEVRTEAGVSWELMVYPRFAEKVTATGGGGAPAGPGPAENTSGMISLPNSTPNRERVEAGTVEVILRDGRLHKVLFR